MVVLDESGSSSEDSSSNLMDFFSSKNKGKMIESFPRRKKKSRVLQIGGNLKEFEEGEIDDVMEAIMRSKADLRFCGQDRVENQVT